MATRNEARSENPCYLAAYDYAKKLGWRVIPLHHLVKQGCSCANGDTCLTPGKHPRLNDWPNAASADLATIEGWWQATPRANLGLPTGKVNRLVALDVDPRAGGDDALHALEAEHGPLPRTVRALTGGGGEHIYLAYPEEDVSSCRLGDGLEFKSDGAQIVLPPSTHYSGRPYLWEITADPHDTPIAPMPAWLLTLVREKGRASQTRKARDSEREIIPASPAQWAKLLVRCSRLTELLELQKAGRVDYDLWLQVGALCVHGGEAGAAWFLDFTAAFPDWRYAHEPNGNPRLRPTDPQQGARYSRQKALEWLNGGLSGPATCQGLKCATLPCHFDPFVVRSTGEIKSPSPIRHCTPQAHLSSTSKSASNGHGGQTMADLFDDEPDESDADEGDESAGEARIAPIDVIACPPLPDDAKLDEDGIEETGLWIDAYIAQSMAISPMTPRAFHESAAYCLVAAAVARRVKLQTAFGSIYPNLFVAWVAPTTLWHKTTALNYARSVAQRAFTHLLAPNEWTPESLLSDLSGAQPRNLDEFSDVARAEWVLERNFCAQRIMAQDEMSGLLASAGKEYNQGMIETLMQLFDCNPDYRRSTRGQGRLNIKHTYLTMLGASTPRALAQHLTEERLWAMGWWPRFGLLCPDEERPEWALPIDQEEPAWIVDALQSLYKRLPQPYYPTPPVALSMALAPEVHTAWQRYSKAMSYDLLTEDLDRRLWGTYGRLPVLVLKLATLLAALDWGDAPSPQIELCHLARAMATAETWRASAHRVLAMATSSEFDLFRSRVIRQVARYEPKGATIRDLCKAMRDKKPEDIQETVQQLVLAGDLESAGRKSAGGRPAERYRIARG